MQSDVILHSHRTIFRLLLELMFTVVNLLRVLEQAFLA